jgi:hypothetical protein
MLTRQLTMPPHNLTCASCFPHNMRSAPTKKDQKKIISKRRNISLYVHFCSKQILHGPIVVVVHMKYYYFLVLSQYFSHSKLLAGVLATVGGLSAQCIFWPIFVHFSFFPPNDCAQNHAQENPLLVLFLLAQKSLLTLKVGKCVN